MRRIALLALLVPAAAVASWPLGDEIAPAILFDVTPAGFDAVSDVVGEVVPETVPIDPISFNDSWCALKDPWFGFCIVNNWYKLDITELSVEPAISALQITPVPGKLELDTTLDVGINRPADPLVLKLDAKIGDIIFVGGVGVKQTCYAYIDPFEVDVATNISMQVIPDGAGGRRLDATVGALVWDMFLSGSQVNMWGSDCAVDDIRSFFQWFGWDPFDLLIDYAQDAIGDTIQDLGSEIEQQLEDIFASATIEQEVALGSAPLLIRAQPSDVDIDHAGMRIALGGSFDTAVHPCVLPYGPTGSLETSAGVPPIGSAPTGIPTPHHVGVLVSDDFVNNGLYAAWVGGLLCVELTRGDGLPIDTNLLNLLSKDIYGDLFPETRPIVLVTRPTKPPVASPGGPSDLDIAIRGLGLDFYAPLDHRMARVLGAELRADVGVDFDFDGVSGELLVDIEFDPGQIGVDVLANEFAPGQDEVLEARFGALFDTVLGPLVGGIIEDIRFSMPSFEGIGLASLDVAPSGPAKDWFGFYAQAGPVTYEGAGCSDTGTGCEGGCGGGALPSRPFVLLVPLVIAGLHRRRR